MAGPLRTQVHSPVGREPFRLLCVGICGRPSDGKILLDHYRYKRGRSAGDERLCHQPVTAMRLPTARPKAPATLSCLLAKVAKKGQAPAYLGGKIAPKPDKVTACLATRLHNYPDRESFLPERHFFMALLFPHSSQGGCATNARKRAAPSPCRRDMLRSSRTKRWAQQHRLRKFVAGRYSLSAQAALNAIPTT